MARVVVSALAALLLAGGVAAMEGGGSSRSSSSSGAGGGGWRGQWNASPSWGWRAGGDDWHDWRQHAGWDRDEGWRQSWGFTTADPSQTGRPPTGDGKRRDRDGETTAPLSACAFLLLANTDSIVGLAAQTQVEIGSPDRPR